MPMRSDTREEDKEEEGALYSIKEDLFPQHRETLYVHTGHRRWPIHCTNFNAAWCQ
jgi:hypothetical protein